ncbi:MAG TPA: hypothetical protein DEA47_04500 [Peptococcaceae bacterium]|nr:MAG: hypothetical protein XD50_1582 [Clostridia bacterium 41_269]HBT20606.1 hypothetical protein [Peptococcaceae bacterium]
MRENLQIGFIAGAIGSVVLTLSNWITNKLKLTKINLITVATDFILGKALLKRKGAVNYIVGTIANFLIGGIFGSLLALLMGDYNSAEQEKNLKQKTINDLAAGFVFGLIIWMFTASLGNRRAPTIQGPVKAKSALWLFGIHSLYGITTSFLIRKIQSKLEPA